MELQPRKTEMTSASKNHITVCICTCHRDVMLERLLRRLAVQETAQLFDLSVVVVDNDAEGPSRDLVQRLGNELSLRVSYDVEPVHTIPAVRNHALRLAKGNYIAMIDDDEFPPPNWLITMYRAIQTFDVDGVLGPVRPFFERQPPAWLLRGEFSGAPAYPTGTLMRWEQTYAGNALLKATVCSVHNVRFDESYTIGGEDRTFFKSAIDVGCRFVAVEEGTVYETVPPERWMKKYYLRRAFVNGFNAHKAERGRGWSVSRIMTSLKSVAAVCVYTVALPFASLFGAHVFVTVLEKGGHHLSRLFATFHVQLLKERGF
jgi:succinoglycan biosynthesis protein ExoM